MQIIASSFPLEQNSILRQKPEIPDTPKIERPKQESSETKVDKSENINKLKNALAENNITLKFRQDTDTKELVVELVDSKTGEAIRQMPSEISLKLAAIFVKMQGQFIDKQ